MLVQNDKRGTTLVELLVVIALFTLVGGLAIGVLIATISGSAKSKSLIETQENARFAMQQMVYEIKRSRGIEATSDFAVNLATTAAATLDLDMPDAPRDPTTFRVTSGVLQVRQGTGAFVSLTTNDVAVSALQFENRSRTNGRSRNIEITLTVTAPDASKSGALITYTVEGSAELRAK